MSTIRYSEHIEIRFDGKLRNSQGNTWDEVLPDVYDLIERLHPAWHEQAACRGVGVETFFLPPHRSAEIAMGLCRECPVRVECRADWLEMPSTQGRHGIWFGTSERGRRGMRFVGRQ